MYYFRPNFWEATSHIKRVQPTSARGSTLILNLSDLVFCVFLLLFLQRPSHLSKSPPPLTETPPQLWVLAAWSHNGFGLQVLGAAHGAHNTIWGHTSKVHSGDFLIQAALIPLLGLWYTRHWNFVLQILCESPFVQNTIISNYSFYKIVVEHIPSCVLNW